MARRGQGYLELFLQEELVLEAARAADLTADADAVAARVEEDLAKIIEVTSNYPYIKYMLGAEIIFYSGRQ